MTQHHTGIFGCSKKMESTDPLVLFTLIRCSRCGARYAALADCRTGNRYLYAYDSPQHVLGAVSASGYVCVKCGGDAEVTQPCAAYCDGDWVAVPTELNARTVSVFN